MKSEGYEMDKLNIEDIENVAGGLPESVDKFVTEDGRVVNRARLDDDTGGQAKQYRGASYLIKAKSK